MILTQRPGSMRMFTTRGQSGSMRMCTSRIGDQFNDFSPTTRFNENVNVKSGGQFNNFDPKVGFNKNVHLKRCRSA